MLTFTCPACAVRLHERFAGAADQASLTLTCPVCKRAMTQFFYVPTPSNDMRRETYARYRLFLVHRLYPLFFTAHSFQQDDVLYMCGPATDGFWMGTYDADGNPLSTWDAETIDGLLDAAPPDVLTLYLTRVPDHSPAEAVTVE